MPRPTRLRDFFDPTLGCKSCSFIFLFHFFHLDQVANLRDHATQSRRIDMFDRLVHTVKTQSADGVLLAECVANGALNQRDAQPFFLGSRLFSHSSYAPRTA